MNGQIANQGVESSRRGRPLEAHQALTPSGIEAQNRYFRGTGGVSRHNRQKGFSPGFLDSETGCMYPAKFSDGHLAPCHILDGLPATLILRRAATGLVLEVSNFVVAGFLRRGRFYSRQQAAAIVQRVHQIEVARRATPQCSRAAGAGSGH